MTAYMDFLNRYVMGGIQLLFGFVCFARLLNKKVRFYYHILFAVCGAAVIYFVPEERFAELGVYVLLLMASGIFLCRADIKSAVLYAALVVEVMQLSYGIVGSLLRILYPLMHSFHQDMVGLVFMVLGDFVPLLLTGVCCLVVYRCFSYYEAVKKQYVFLVLIPVLMLFFTEEYFNSVVYGLQITYGGRIRAYENPYHMLAVQFLGMVSLFCILFSYKKLLQGFRLSTELSLLEQEEHSLNRYVEEAKMHYEKTASFRHDIRNHILVMKKLLQNNKTEEALEYIWDMDEMAEGLSFPCSTNNPVVDILIGKKFGIAASMGIDVCCSLILPYPSGLRDIDVCIILSNALDNALCACKNMEEGSEKFIRVSGRIQGDFVYIEIENSFQGNERFEAGTGLSNVKAVTEKYNGAMSIRTQGMVFHLDVLLIIPHQKESSSQQTD